VVTPYPLLCRLHCTNICKATLFSQQRKGELQQGRKKAEQILIDDHEIRQLILTRPSSTSKPKHHTMAVILFCLVRCPNPICMYVCMHGTRSLERCMESARAPGVCVTLLCSSVGRAGVASRLDPVLNTQTAARQDEAARTCCPCVASGLTAQRHGRRAAAAGG